MKPLLQALLAAICLLAPGTARAQAPAEGTIDLFGSLGYARFASGSTSWGSGLEFGGGAEFLPFTGRLRSLGIVGGISMLETSRSVSGGPEQTVNARQFTAAGTWHFSRGPVQPYVLGGLAVLSAERTWWCDQCSYTPDPATGRLVAQELRERVDDTNAGVLVGGGVKLVPGKRLSFRAEASWADTTPGAGWNWHWSGVRGAVGIRF